MADGEHTRKLDTTGELARLSKVAQPTVRLYADLGYLRFIRASNGTRLFEPGQANKVREIYSKRMAGRGRQSR
jgi:DNA-binding transcriptional MerR regulator